MKVILIKIFAVVVLLGVINSTVIEPAFCFQHDDAVSQQQENGQCCVVCHPTHHQGIVPINISPNFNATNSAHFTELLNLSLLDSPIRPIFHPPLRLA